MLKDIAFHFRCYEDRNYAEFPEDFILQSLRVANRKVACDVYTGDLHFLQLQSEIPIPQETLLREWLTKSELQTLDQLELASSYVIRLTSIPEKTEAMLHLSLAQHEEYLGKVEVEAETNLLHRHFYKHRLLPLARIAIPESTLRIFYPISEAEPWDIKRREKFESFGYTTELSSYDELFRLEYDGSDAVEVQTYLKCLLHS